VEQVRLVSVGLGWWGGVLADTVTKLPEASLVGCYARSEDTRQAFAAARNCRAFESLDDVLASDGVDGLLVATPHSTHAPIIEQAAEAGKHVFVEKPLTLTVAHGRRAVAAAERGGIVLQVGHHRRRDAPLRRIRALLDAGELGELHHLEGTHSVPKNLQSPAGWRNDPNECPAGSMTGLGVHVIDNFHYLAGPIRRVHAFSKRLHGAAQLDDVTTVNVEFVNGPLGSLGTCFVVPKTIRLGAYGTRAAAWSDDDGTRLYTQQVDQPARQEQAVGAVDALSDQLLEYVRSIQGQARPEIDGPTALAVVAVLEAIVRSTETGEVEDVEAVGWT
jgi:UDP-N-acetyl-2-amino-2-deoxyglucuronate dehydrogenase